MEEAPVIRQASTADAASLAAFASRVFDEVFGPQNDAADMAAYLAEAFAPHLQHAEIARPGSIVLIAERPGACDIVGYAHLVNAETPACVRGHSPIELKRLYVDPSIHNRGLGKRLLDEGIARAKRAGAETVWLGVWEHNVKAQRFYMREGFTRAGEHVFVLGSDTQTDWIMQRSLA